MMMSSLQSLQSEGIMVRPLHTNEEEVYCASNWFDSTLYSNSAGIPSDPGARPFLNLLMTAVTSPREASVVLASGGVVTKPRHPI